MRNKIFYIGMFIVMLFYPGGKKAQAQLPSLYNDIRAHNVGDVITVILTENISGSSSTKANTSSNTDGSAKSGISSNILPFDPTFGGNAQLTYDSDENMSASQKQLLQGTLSVRIKDVGKNGTYLIVGHRSTEVNGEKYKMFLKGYVRPSDISQANRVLSYRIADAKIRFLKKESLTAKKHRPGLGRKLLWGILGVATGAAAFMLAK
jgi:flagellar L-ring protein precursor FlgH